MKLSWKQIEPFLKNPDPAARVILVYGPDTGLVKERASILGKTVLEDLNDPFNAVQLTADQITEDPARLSDEAGAISMMGGDRLIRITDGADKLTVTLKAYLENPSPSALIVIEADNLTPRSSLRKLCESAKNAAALPCYVEDERDVARLIRDSLQAEGLSVQPDAVSWLAANIAGDRGRVRSEIEKIIIYKGAEPAPLSLNEAQAICGEGGAQTLDTLIYAVGARQADNALNAYHLLLQDGVAFIVILRALMTHFRRLHMVKSRIEAGDAIEVAMKKLQPPIFFKQEAQFKGQVNGFSSKALLLILERFSALEADCKKTGAPAETLIAQAILGLTQRKAA